MVVGRKLEIQRFEQLKKSKKSEFVAVYGRRRIGKTFLIREFFKSSFTFQIAGLANAKTKQQLFNFHYEFNTQTNDYYENPPENWLVAFQRLSNYLQNLGDKQQKVIFFDELPWFDTKGSDFVMGLEHFWNAWASNRKDILLIVCGSAAFWMVNELINNKGGLHNRITHSMKIGPFNLQETEEMLIAKKCVFDRYQILQLYMAMGGIPYYLEAIQAHLSASQNIQELFFSKSGLLKNEFQNLYRSLFKKYEIYEKVVEILSTKKNGMLRSELINHSGISSGGTITKVLIDLEESEFIGSYISLDNKQKNKIYRLSDYYTSFYFHFIKNSPIQGENAWTNMIDSPKLRAWQGYRFEQICLDHIKQIKKALGISGIQSSNASWRGKTEEKSAQIDLLIDRRDQVINLCECKFSIDTFIIDKAYSDNLRSKINILKTLTKTKKAVYLTFITTFGVEKNKYADMVQNEVLMDDLF